MTGEEQVAQWVAGKPTCPNDRGGCCPDFSCCVPELMWDEDKRERFQKAEGSERMEMLAGVLWEPLSRMRSTRSRRRRHARRAGGSTGWCQS
jgi:hypothetical protein